MAANRGYFFFFGLAVFCTVTVTVSIALPPELTVTIVVSLPHFESRACPGELSVSVRVFVVPGESVAPPLATTTCFVVVCAFFFLPLAVIAVILLPLRCSSTVASRLAGAHATPPAGHEKVAVSLPRPPETDTTWTFGVGV